MTPRTFKGPLIKIDESWHPGHSTQETFAGNFLTLDVPDDEEWQILCVAVAYTSSADIGNRQIALSIQQLGGLLIFYAPAGIVQPASEDYVYQFAPGVPDAIVLRENVLTTPIPSLAISPTDVILVYEVNDVDDTTDGLRVDIQYLCRKV